MNIDPRVAHGLLRSLQLSLLMHGGLLYALAASIEPVEPSSLPVSPRPTSGIIARPALVDEMVLPGRGERCSHEVVNCADPDAISLGCEWLARQQSPGGMWRFRPADGPCPNHPRTPGYCLGANLPWDDVGMTSLALRALRHGEARDCSREHALERGTAALLRRQQPDGAFGRGNSRVPVTALAVLTLLDLREPGHPRHDRQIRAGLAFLLEAQEDGGWKSSSGQLRCDGVATSLVLCALARGPELVKTGEAIRLGLADLDRVSDHTYGVTGFSVNRIGDCLLGYTWDVELSTGLAWQARRACGIAPPSRPEWGFGVDFLLDSKPEWDDDHSPESQLARWWFALQSHLPTSHGHPGQPWSQTPEWRQWHLDLAETLAAQQERPGSWPPPPGRPTCEGDRVQTTTLALLILEDLIWLRVQLDPVAVPW